MEYYSYLEEYQLLNHIVTTVVSTVVSGILFAR